MPDALTPPKKRHSSLRAYFEFQRQCAKADPEFRPDTMEAMAARHGVTPQTIWRVKDNQPTSYALAKELSDAYKIAFKSFNLRTRQKADRSA